jgi:hypothetical protein
MSSVKIDTAMKMLESLPDHVQDRVLDHLREYIENIESEMKEKRDPIKIALKLIE